jgi:pyruvate formate-lyase activating enzyme-like uncharacterized protein
MEAFYTWLNSLQNKNKAEFSQWPVIKWANPYLINDYQDQRKLLLDNLTDNLLYKDTKPFLNHISKGCEICASGKWSCLFITNKCNARCFYCPTQQKNDEIPSTQGLDFDDPYKYASYINHFGFKGVSFSGGEPFLYFERTLQYLKVLREKCNKELYIWIYTNGILVDELKLKALANLNLNEIRFDIGATGFSLDKVQMAQGIIPNITIEIPAIPEEKDKIIALLPKMIETGVNNLNLHHLRLTQHNAKHLIKREYSIDSAERPLVIESEMAALEIITEAKKLELKIGINYCSFHYKNRFQKAGYRNTLCEKLFPIAEITKNGYIRDYKDNSISYYSLKLFNYSDDISMASNIEIGEYNFSYTLTKVFEENNLSTELIEAIDELLEIEPINPPADTLLFTIWQFEYIEEGLRSW